MNAQDDRKDWVWTGTIDSGGAETEVPALTPGKYTIEWTIGYVMTKNSTWATNNGSFVPQASKAGATHIYVPNGKADVWKGGDNVIKTHTMTGSSELVIKGDLRLTVAPQNVNGDGTYANDGISIGGANGTGKMASGGIYQGLKVCQWNEVKTAASYDVYYRVHGATNWIKKANVTTNSYDGFGAQSLTEASKYDFKAVALDANGNEMCYDEKTIDIYTLRDVAVDFKAVQADDMTWTIEADKLSGETYAFASVSFKIRDGSTVVAEGSKNLGNELAGNAFNIWLGNRATACYYSLTNNDWDGRNMAAWAADTFSGKKTYTVEYTLNAKPMLPTGWKNAGSYDGWSFSCVLFKNEAWSNVSKTTTLTLDAKNVIDWDYVCGAYAVAEWDNPWWHKDATRRYQLMGHGFWHNYVKLASDCKVDGNPCGTPKDGQRYGVVYSWNNHAFFNIASTEIDPQTWEPKSGTGCYALTDLIDRETDIDKVIDNKSYYDKNEEAFYFSFTLTSGGTVYRHCGKLHSRGTVAEK